MAILITKVMLGASVGLLAVASPPNLIDVLLSIKMVLIPIGLIGVAKLVVYAVRWNYKKINDFTKDYKSDSLKSSIIRAQRVRQAKKAMRQNNPKTKTDSANFFAIIARPFSGFFNWLRSFFK